MLFRSNLFKELLASAELTEETDLLEAQKGILDGNACIVLEGYPMVVVVNTFSSIGRKVSTAEIETTIMGPKAAFVELLQDNMAMIRQRVRSVDLKVEKFMYGTKTQVTLHFLYLKDVAPSEVVEAMRDRLSQLKVDELHDIAQLSELIEVSPLSPFPQTIVTERPDKVSANLLEGRVALLLAGAAEALVLPAAFRDRKSVV